MAGFVSQGGDIEAQSEKTGGGGVYELGNRTSGRDDDRNPTGSNVPKGETEDEGQVGSPARSQAQDQEAGLSNSGENDQLDDGSAPSDTPPPAPPTKPRMIGDFDDSTNALWSLHAKEAKSHDESRIQSLKDDMDGVLIFVPLGGLFSAALTSFIIDKLQGLQVDPMQQMVYYQQQNIALLAQISQQISSIAPQVSIPSTLPPPYPDFSPNPSDVRVNVYWFMSLVFSLSAALLATLVQQWVRDYMHVFQRYSHPLKSARLRQYLHEGVEGWYMPVVAESVPGLVHVSLFLFFLGLSDSLLALNTTIGITTIVPITACSLLYIFSTFAPVIYPQSPFQNSFSGLIWYLTQKVHPRRYLDRASGGAYKAVSSNMSEGQMQLAMEENDGRQGRDVRAIQWLIHNLTEDIEMESLVLAIPGSFTTEWGIAVWRKASEVKRHKDANPGSNGPAVRSRTDADTHLSVLPRRGLPLPRRLSHPVDLFHPLRRIVGRRAANDTPRNAIATRSTSHLSIGSNAPDLPPAYEDLAIHELCRRVQHLVDTCNNHGLFTNEDSWRRRARGCTETVASLVCCADIKLELFGDFRKLLSHLGELEKIPDLSAAGSDGTFVTRWTCLSLVVARGIMDKDSIREHANTAIKALSTFPAEDDDEPTKNGDDNEKALKNSRRIDNHFETARRFCVYGLEMAFRPLESDRGLTAQGRVREVLARDHEASISKLERIASTLDHMEDIDLYISLVDHTLRAFTCGLIDLLPGVSSDELKRTAFTPPGQLFKFAVAEGRSVAPQFIFFRQRLGRLCSYAPRLREIIERQDNVDYQETFESLSAIWDNAHGRGLIVNVRNLMERQLWRLQDLRDGGGFGVSVELFFLALAQLLFTSQDSHSTLYIGTFRLITSDWRQHKNSTGTQHVILNLVLDVAVRSRGVFSGHSYPSYITDELLVLLGNMVEGQSGTHIDDAMRELNDPWVCNEWIHEDKAFGREASEVISRLRAPFSSS